MRASVAVLSALALAAAGGLSAAPASPPRARAEEKRPAPRAARGAADYDAPSDLWREGPVRYLLTKNEDDAFRALAADEDRAAFIQRFWASRDPVGSTPENEYRAIFYVRVAEANRRFTDSTKPGWKTDRGKIFILLGPPDDLEVVQGRDDLNPGSFVWIYRSPPGGERTESLPAIRFTKDATGEYHLSNDVALSGFETPSRIAFQIQAIQIKSLPEKKTLLDTIVGARALFDASPFRSHRDFFRSSDGDTFTVFTLGVKTELLGTAPATPAGARPPDQVATGAPGAGPAATGSDAAPAAGRGRFEVLTRLVGDSPDLPSYDFAEAHGLLVEDGAPAPGPTSYLLFQGGMPIRPGTYTAYYGLIDHASDQIYSFKETVEIPDFQTLRFTLSHITLASRLERLDASHTAYTTPFVLGNLRALPRPDDTFRKGEEFAFYYQIYAPDIDPIDGRPDLDLEYRFFAAQADGAGGLRFSPLGKPIRLTRQRSQVQGYALPLDDWPPGTYRLRVQVTDNLSDQRSTEEISFRVL